MGEYTPNHIPKQIRIFNIVWILILIGLAVYGAFYGSIYWPGKSGNQGILFEGASLIFFIIALVVSAVNTIITLVDHYDKRNNEGIYKKASYYLNILGVIAVIAAFGFQYFEEQKNVIVYIITGNPKLLLS